MELIIQNRTISASAFDILVKVRSELNGVLLSTIEDKGDNVICTCPFHKGGKENRPSCGVYARKDNPDKEFGLVHCFTCGYSATLPQFIGDIFHSDENFGTQWLLKRFCDIFIDTFEPLKPISIQVDKEQRKEGMSDSILSEYDYYHPYMWKRGLSKEVVDRFRVGYDKTTNSITFPMWDEYGALVGISKRCIDTKRFDNQHGVKKPVYLLNYIKQCNITTVFIAESQINALTLWSWGYPAVALMGTGSDDQYEQLSRSGIRVYNLCFDGDTAGDKATERFKKKVRTDSIINIIKIPYGKDVNDLKKEEFDMLYKDSTHAL